jgi:hypothetical protein
MPLSLQIVRGSAKRLAGKKGPAKLPARISTFELHRALTGSLWRHGPEGDTATYSDFCFWEEDGWADWYPDPEYTSYPETNREEWRGCSVDKVTFCRAIRDELASRFDRGYIHEQVGYDS